MPPSGGGYASIGEDAQSPSSSATSSATSSPTSSPTSTSTPTSTPTSSPTPAAGTSYTLSTKRQHHQVRIQGRLMLVKSVSNFGLARKDDDEGDRAASEPDRPDRQRRGYGIGGAGNIRHPAEVVHFYSTSNRTVADDIDRRRGKRRWQWMSSLLGRTKEARASDSYERY